METALIFRIGILSVLSFIVAFVFAPLLTKFLYKHKLGKQIRDSKDTPIYSTLHKKKAGTPTMGGTLIWATVLVLALIFYLLSILFPETFFDKLNFLTREQTLLPLGILIATAIVGLIDDYLGVKKIGPKGGGLSVSQRLGLFTVIAIIGSLWFYFKLDWDVFHIPFLGNFEIGLWYIPIFIFIVASTTHSINLTDGLDGLAGGILATVFAALGAICFTQGKFELAVLCGVIMGALVAFLWFNINPARFIMGDTGSASLGITVGIIAMLTNTAILLIIICFIPLIETSSVIIQTLSKKIRHKKIFLSTPIHHHFEGKGWSEPKIVMRFWLISSIMAVLGVIVFLVDKGWY